MNYVFFTKVMKETENNAYLWEDGSEECEGDAFHKVPSVWS